MEEKYWPNKIVVKNDGKEKVINRFILRKNLLSGSSVTRLGDFWKFMVNNLRTKVAH